MTRNTVGTQQKLNQSCGEISRRTDEIRLFFATYFSYVLKCEYSFEILCRNAVGAQPKPNPSICEIQRRSPEFRLFCCAAFFAEHPRHTQTGRGREGETDRGRGRGERGIEGERVEREEREREKEREREGGGGRGRRRGRGREGEVDTECPPPPPPSCSNRQEAVPRPLQPEVALGTVVARVAVGNRVLCMAYGPAIDSGLIFASRGPGIRVRN